MSWNKIEEYLFERHCVEREDKELCSLMEEHDKEIRNKVIEELLKRLNEKCNSIIAEKWYSKVAPASWANAYTDFKDDIDEIAEQTKETE